MTNYRKTRGTGRAREACIAELQGWVVDPPSGPKKSDEVRRKSGDKRNIFSCGECCGEHRLSPAYLIDFSEVVNPWEISKECGKGGKPASWLSTLPILCHFHGLLFAAAMLDKPICRHSVQCGRLATQDDVPPFCTFFLPLRTLLRSARDKGPIRKIIVDPLQLNVIGTVPTRYIVGCA